MGFRTNSFIRMIAFIVHVSVWWMINVILPPLSSVESCSRHQSRNVFFFVFVSNVPFVFFFLYETGLQNKKQTGTLNPQRNKRLYYFFYLFIYLQLWCFDAFFPSQASVSSTNVSKFSFFFVFFSLKYTLHKISHSAIKYTLQIFFCRASSIEREGRKKELHAFFKEPVSSANWIS